MFIELHILQNFAPSNLNRDDTGNPKDTDFGGVRRARISSQCIKRAIRREDVFAKTTAVELADRTKWITRLIAGPLAKAGKDEQQALAVAEAFANELGIGTETDKKTGQPKSKVLLYLSKSEIAEIVAVLQEKWDDIVSTLKEGKSPALKPIVNEWVKALKNRTSAPDIALFGRMLAEKPDLNLDAACQVAHAISTHRVSMELDYYTAVDDLQQDDETGAGMIGVTAFDSATYYRYARIDWKQLLRNLGWRDPADAKSAEQKAIREQNTKVVELAKKTVEGFLRAVVTAVPTGKQNAFAAQNPPDFLLGVAREDGAAWSLANAFETPVKADRDGGYLKPSLRALDAYWGRLTKIYGAEGVTPAALCLPEDAPLENLKEAVKDDREKWLAAILAELE
ncbi:MAG: type I-E CRISPR-associated protein Cas7/Cse4/CasC [Chloroflexi bacterium]|nr:type I-E CRISPR-associated protein Cas7/Cse4/CasC [Chloroflexota bacterium]